VNRRIRVLTLFVVTTMFCGGPALAADEAASDVTVAKDLTAVIALQGMPCGQVISTSEQGKNDYLATCQDGTRYRVFVNADGRVIVTKQ
jgi:hypothetical protein